MNDILVPLGIHFHKAESRKKCRQMDLDVCTRVLGVDVLAAEEGRQNSVKMMIYSRLRTNKTTFYSVSPSHANQSICMILIVP